MQPGRTLLHALLCTVLSISLVLGGCDDGESNGNGNGGNKDGNVADGPVCNQPPDIAQCSAPPNMFSETRYYCKCTGACGGGTFTAACNPTIGDCRFFYDDCIPRSYSRCDDNATDFVLGLCGYCFFIEAGIRTEPLEDCDKLSMMDAGATFDNGSGGNDSSPAVDTGSSAGDTSTAADTGSTADTGPVADSVS